MDRTYKLMKIYQGLWWSEYFENDLKKEFYKPFKKLLRNENQLTDEEVDTIYDLYRTHPVFN